MALNKYLKYFKTDTEYKAAVTSGLVKPNVAYVEGEDGCRYYYSETTVAGDIAYWNGSKIVFCSYSNWEDTLGTPVGVVVVPSTHTTDGTSRIMSLPNMSLKTPETGSLSVSNVSGDNYMYWGNASKDLAIPNRIANMLVDPTTGDTTGYDGDQMGYAQTNITPWYYEENGTPYSGTKRFYDHGDEQSTIDADGSAMDITFTNGYATHVLYLMYDTDSSEWGEDYDEDLTYVQSPYNSDGTKESLFVGGCMATGDMEGKENSKIILSNVTANIKGTTITNSSATGNYPAASCCSRFHTLGTMAGDWYLPALGELCYMYAKLKEVNAALTKLGSSKAVCVGDWFTYSTLGSWLWSSTEYSSLSAWYLSTSSGYCDGGSKSFNSTHYRVRAFCAL